MSNADATARATYTDAQLVRDGALACRVSEDDFSEWLADDRRLSLEMTAVELFKACEHYSQRAMRVRAALLDLPPIDEEFDAEED